MAPSFPFLLAMGIGACSESDRLVGTVGDGGTSVLDQPFGSPAEIVEVMNPGFDQQDPTLTEDELEMFFTLTQGSQIDIWTTTRASTADDWSAPTRVAELSTQYSDSGAEVSSDGLTIYFASNRPGPSTALHLWRAQRASRDAVWSMPVAITDPAPAAQELAPSLDCSGLWLAFASVRDTKNFDLYLTHRDAPSDPWGTVSALTSLDSNVDDWDPALFAGATHILFSSQRSGSGDLFRAQRTTTDEPFSAPVPVAELNTSSSEGDPWMSCDGRRLYFSSNRSGIERIYWTQR